MLILRVNAVCICAGYNLYDGNASFGIMITSLLQNKPAQIKLFSKSLIVLILFDNAVCIRDRFHLKRKRRLFHNNHVSFAKETCTNRALFQKPYSVDPF